MMRDNGPPRAPGPAAGDQSVSLSRQPLSILFVDPDVQRTTHLAQDLPRPIDYRVVPSAQAALQVIQLRMPDLIVTELNLPDASGIDLIAHVHRMPQTRNILFLVLTARSSVRDKIAAFQAGADDYLVKPSSAQELGVHIHLLSRFQRVIGRA